MSIQLWHARCPIRHAVYVQDIHKMRGIVLVVCRDTAHLRRARRVILDSVEMSGDVVSTRDDTRIRYTGTSIYLVTVRKSPSISLKFPTDIQVVFA